MSLFSPLALPSGAIIRNRIAKAAMEENMADADHAPSAALLQLYQRWADGGAGLIITGNVMVDGRAMTGPGGVVLEDDRHLDRFIAWAETARSRGAQMWMQINHPGRQMPAALRQPALAPSAVALEMGALSRQFAPPRAMTEADIEEVIARFIRSAELAERAGFSGVQIHAAHGYLLHQFLSPLSNRRTDGYGGSLPNRLRLLVEVFDAVRAAVSDKVAVGVRISASDWVEGGWDLVQSEALAQVLDARGCNFLHVSSGGLDERQKITVGPGYQVPFAAAIKAKVRMPVIAVGMITEPEQAESILRHRHADAVALARGILYDPRWPWHAAAALRDSVEPAPQYLRCEPRDARGVFKAR